jgi:transcription initiation factor TFIIB
MIGRSYALLEAATLYAAYRVHGEPITIDALADRFDVSRKELAATYRMIVQELKLKPQADSPERYVAKHARMFGKRNSEEALEILARAREAKIHLGRKPACLAAAALYLASGGQLLQKDLAKFFGVSGVGIRLSTEALRPFLLDGGRP